MCSQLSLERVSKKIDIYEKINNTSRKEISGIIKQYYIPDIAKIITDYTIIISSKDAFRFVSQFIIEIPISIKMNIESIFDLIIISIVSNDIDLFKLLGRPYFYEKFDNDMKSIVIKSIERYQTKNNWSKDEVSICFQLLPPYIPPHMISSISF
jgi:hypothetical protein